MCVRNKSIHWAAGHVALQTWHSRNHVQGVMIKYEVTDDYHTPILTWRKSVFIWKGEQSYFTSSFWWVKVSKGESKESDGGWTSVEGDLFRLLGYNCRQGFFRSQSWIPTAMSVTSLKTWFYRALLKVDFTPHSSFPYIMIFFNNFIITRLNCL